MINGKMNEKINLNDISFINTKTKWNNNSRSITSRCICKYVYGHCDSYGLKWCKDLSR